MGVDRYCLALELSEVARKTLLLKSCQSSARHELLQPIPSAPSASTSRELALVDHKIVNCQLSFADCRIHACADSDDRARRVIVDRRRNRRSVRRRNIGFPRMPLDSYDYYASDGFSEIHKIHRIHMIPIDFQRYLWILTMSVTPMDSYGYQSIHKIPMIPMES